MSSTPVVWSDWQPLAIAEPLSPAVLAEVLDGGQTFRWNRLPDGVWQGIWAGCVARLKSSETGGLLWSAPQDLVGTVAGELPVYFGASVRFDRIVDDLPSCAELIDTIVADAIKHLQAASALVV